jgi:hypothetical protein
VHYLLHSGEEQLSSRLKGVGFVDAWISPPLEYKGEVERWWNAFVISPGVYHDVKTYCDYKDITYWIINNVSVMAMQSKHGRSAFPNHDYDSKIRLARARGEIPPSSARSEKCHAALVKSREQFANDINILEYYADTCRKGTKPVHFQSGTVNWCSGDQLSTYVNRPEVQKALHAKEQLWPWSACGCPECSYSTTSTQADMLPYLKHALTEHKNFNIGFFSGTNDLILSFEMSRLWIYPLVEQANLTETKEFHHWYLDTNGEQIGGWGTRWQSEQSGSKFSYSTIRGSGHEIRREKKRDLHAFKHFLETGYMP